MPESGGGGSPGGPDALHRADAVPNVRVRAWAGIGGLRSVGIGIVSPESGHGADGRGERA